MKITKKTVDAAEYAGGTDYRWDDSLTGFGLRLYPSGRKSFVITYRENARKKVVILGAYGVLTVEEARKKAKEMLAEIALGQSPETRKRGKAAKLVTIAELAERYLQEHAIPKKKPKSVEEDQRMILKTIIPTFGEMPVAELSQEDVARLHNDLRDTPTKANRVLALISKMMNLAERWRLRPDGTNPCRHVERYREKQRQRFLTGEELARLGEALREAETYQTEPLEAIAVIRLLLLTGCRKGEILTLEWSHVDFQRRCLILPDSKTGAKLVPLGAAAMQLIVALPRAEESPYVIPGRHGKGHFVGVNHVWERIRNQADLEDVRLHDLRHSFASVGAGGGLGLPVIGKLLGHKNPSTTARYSHLADDPLKRAADQIAEEIAGALG